MPRENGELHVVKYKKQGDYMVPFLLFLSFLLNIVCLFSIVILYSRQNRYSEMEKNQKKIIAEMEDVISTYLIEMKEENDEFIRSFKSQEHNDTEDKTSPQRNNPEPNGKAQKKSNWTGTGYKRASEAYLQTKRPESEPIDDLDKKPGKSEHDPLLHQVLSMKEMGMSMEEIAKSVGKGQTEIELLLKFRQIM